MEPAAKVGAVVLGGVLFIIVVLALLETARRRVRNPTLADPVAALVRVLNPPAAPPVNAAA